MKHAFALTAVLMTLGAATPALAVVTLVTFETPTSFESISTHYAGGTDSAGVAGANLGVSFGSDAQALRNDELGPYFSNAPTPIGVMMAAGPDAFMNVPLGFSKLGLFYSSNAAVAAGVKAWSGLDGTGTVLASLSLANNAQQGCSDTAFCRFQWLETTFTGVALSVSFGDAANVAAFDNVRVTAVPEPTSLLLMALGLAGVAGVAARRR